MVGFRIIISSQFSVKRLSFRFQFSVESFAVRSHRYLLEESFDLSKCLLTENWKLETTSHFTFHKNQKYCYKEKDIHHEQQKQIR